jgi:hypothetical protein
MMRTRATLLSVVAGLAIAALTGCAPSANHAARPPNPAPVVSGNPNESALRCAPKIVRYPQPSFRKEPVGLLPMAPRGLTKATLALVPVNVSAAIDCHYAGLNSHRRAGTLLGSTHVRDPQRLARLLNGSPAPHIPVGVPFNCPKDDGAMEQLMFSSPTLGTVYVTVPRNGCRWVGTSMTAGPWQPSEAAFSALGALNVGY